VSDHDQPINEKVRGLERAADEGAALVVIELDAPGGLLDATQSLTASMLGSGCRSPSTSPHRGHA